MLLLALILSISCSKDTDLLAEYVISDAEQARLTGSILLNDSFSFHGDDPLVLDVLANDIIPDPDKVKIIETSQPENGVVIINEDKTLTYIPNDEGQNSEPNDEGTIDNGIEEENPAVEESDSTEEQEEKTVDSFDYVVETELEDGSKEKDEATVIISDNDSGELKAFPTAEGYGKYTSGGRGGAIVEVTNLNCSGKGSLKWALEDIKGPRTIVFRVSGVIECNGTLYVPTGNGDVTIAGETAPGEGIQLRRTHLWIKEDNVIIRYIKFRQEYGAWDYNDPNDPLFQNANCIRIRPGINNKIVKNVIIDHCSLAWGPDQNLATTLSENITVQNSLFGEQPRNFVVQRSKYVSILNNVMAKTYARNIITNVPLNHVDLVFEMQNNIIYGYRYGTNVEDGIVFNVINNAYISSNDFPPADGAIQLNRIYAPNDNPNPNIKASDTKSYIVGNIIPSGTNLLRNEPGWELLSAPIAKSDYAPTPASSLESKLLSHVGASLYRDALDTELINSLERRIGSPNSSGTYPSVATGGTSYPDTDNDGIDDTWEHNINGTIGVADNNGDHDEDGYTNLEEFLHYLSKD